MKLNGFDQESKGGIFMSNGCDGCPLKDDPNACKTMCARDHKRENDRERE